MRFKLFLFILPAILFSQNVSKEFGELNSSLRRLNLQTSIINSLAISDKLLLFLENFMLDSIPSLTNYSLYNTNTFSRITMEKGNYEIEIYSQKFFSNQNINLTVTIDATEDIFSKNLGLFVSFDYLSDKKGFKKIEIQKIPTLIENDNLTMLFIISTNQANQGYTVKMEYLFQKKIDNKLKEEIMITDAKEIIKRMDIRKLNTYLR
ncbi:MAG: hypothetical protein N2258_03115 [Brevinematales bacterium]|nr:hypothetical protein [Brevinematales bacterium]